MQLIYMYTYVYISIYLSISHQFSDYIYSFLLLTAFGYSLSMDSSLRSYMGPSFDQEALFTLEGGSIKSRLCWSPLSSLGSSVQVR